MYQNLDRPAAEHWRYLRVAGIADCPRGDPAGAQPNARSHRMMTRQPMRGCRRRPVRSGRCGSSRSYGSRDSIQMLPVSSVSTNANRPAPADQPFA